ncbi:hypothetical protein V8C86DRAFT_2460781 [Haematococcus lacustris]
MGDCSICLAVVVPQDEAFLLPSCFHRFHYKCICKWVDSEALHPGAAAGRLLHTCPLCRQPFTGIAYDCVDRAFRCKWVGPSGAGQQAVGATLPLTAAQRRRRSRYMQPNHVATAPDAGHPTPPAPQSAGSGHGSAHAAAASSGSLSSAQEPPLACRPTLPKQAVPLPTEGLHVSGTHDASHPSPTMSALPLLNQRSQQAEALQRGPASAQPDDMMSRRAWSRPVGYGPESTSDRPEPQPPCIASPGSLEQGKATEHSWAGPQAAGDGCQAGTRQDFTRAVELSGRGKIRARPRPARSVQDPLVEAWLRRELQALLLVEDVELILALALAAVQHNGRPGAQAGSSRTAGHKRGRGVTAQACRCDPL